MREPVLVSACLLGLRTRYDGASERREAVIEALRGCWVVPLCPEQLGGLPTPRTPAEIENGDGCTVLDGLAMVVARDGCDVTAEYLRGAAEAMKVAELFSVRRAVLKEGSPACGVRRIRRAGGDVSGMGVAAALLHRRGVELDGRE